MFCANASFKIEKTVATVNTLAGAVYNLGKTSKMEIKGEKMNKNILSVPPIKLPPLRGLGSTYFHKMLQYKDGIAQTDGITGETQTYSVVLQKSIRTAIVMRSSGLKPKDVITICSYNHMDSMIPYYASLFLGAISANLDPAVPLSDSVYLLKQVRPKMIFVAPEAVTLMEDTIREAQLDAKIVVFGHASNHTKFSDFLVRSIKENEFVPYEVDNLKDTATIIFSSGTTGMPKGICLTHYGLLGYTYQSNLESILPGTNVLVYPNLYWIASPCFTVCIILYGLNRIIYPKFDVNTVWEVIKRNKVAFVSLNPHQIIGMCAKGRPKEADTSSLSAAWLAGGPISKEIVLKARECLPEAVVVNAYGQTEQNGGTLGFDLDPSSPDRILLEEKPTSVGKPRHGCAYKIVDPDTEEILGPNQPGELRIKTEFGMKGYYNLDSSYVWDSDGFMKTGDIAYYDEDQCFFIVDRIKDLMKYQMWHISPVKLENIFYTHPAVQTCVVTSKPDIVDGDHLMGVVVLKESAVGTVTEEELHKFVDDQVGYQQKLRAGVKFVKSIPLTVTDKPNRRKVKEMVLKGNI